MRVNIRFCTAITMIAICVFALVRGLGIVQFSLVKMEVGSAENRAESMQSWATVRRPWGGGIAISTGPKHRPI